jgi:hypothetical protein
MRSELRTQLCKKLTTPLQIMTFKIREMIMRIICKVCYKMLMKYLLTNTCLMRTLKSLNRSRTVETKILIKWTMILSSTRKGWNFLSWRSNTKSYRQAKRNLELWARKDLNQSMRLLWKSKWRNFKIWSTIDFKGRIIWSARILTEFSLLINWLMAVQSKLRSSLDSMKDF